jgi:hypothetical protein
MFTGNFKMNQDRIGRRDPIPEGEISDKVELWLVK